MLLLNLSRYYSNWPVIAALLPLLMAAHHAVAGAGDTLSFTAGSSLMYDSNVFRLSPLIDPTAFTGTPKRSDQIIISTFTLGLNKTYSMQRFEFNGSIVDNRYHSFDFLDFVGKNYTAAWHWRLTPYLHGRFSAAHSEALNNFANLTGFLNATTRNLRTTDNFHFEGIFEFDRAWHLIGGVDHNVMKNSRLTVQDFDNKIFSVYGGIRYSFASGSSLTYRVKSGNGEFIKRAQPNLENLFDTRFDEMEHEVRLIWPITSKTSIDARAGYLSREHEHFPQRDFSGFVGHFNLNWAVTSKTRLTAGWTRQLSNFQTAAFAFNSPVFQRFSSSYLTADRFSIAPMWQITDKIALRLRYEYVLTDTHGAVVSLPSHNRSDAMHSALIALDWQPMNAVFLSGALHRDHRSSNLRGFDFDSSAATVSAKLTF